MTKTTFLPLLIGPLVLGCESDAVTARPDASTTAPTSATRVDAGDLDAAVATADASTATPTTGDAASRTDVWTSAALASRDASAHDAGFGNTSLREAGFVEAGVDDTSSNDAGGSDNTGGSEDTGGLSQPVDAGCGFMLTKNRVSSAIPTVGITEWTISGDPVTTAKLVYSLMDPALVTLNRGGEAPIDLGQPNLRTLLLGLKPLRNYTFHVEVTRGDQVCSGAEIALPPTGALGLSPHVAVDVALPESREPGFIVTSTGASTPSGAFIIDADGETVWSCAGPSSVSRAHMDYEGRRMWMLKLNVTNQGGEMRSVVMDGSDEQQNVPGLENAHHDFTVLPGGKVAALVWRVPGFDTESDLVIRSPDGSVTTPFKVGDNLYRSDGYHANAIHYVPVDGSFTISDRNPNALVKVSGAGEIQWQLGGSCEDAPAGARCSAQTWEVNHGHHLLEDGTFVLFNNAYGDWSHVLDFQLTDTPETFTAELAMDYTGTAHSSNLGDVQRLPGGNTLVTYSVDGKIVELDRDWNVVQTFSARVGYASWRSTLYGAPERP